MVAHKPGPFKAPKKGHKHGKHKSKSSLALKGKAGKATIVHGKGLSNVLKSDRKNRDLQRRKMKLTQSLDEKKGLGGRGHPPICVAFISAHMGIDVSPTLEHLKNEGGIPSNSDNSFYFYCKKLKKRLHIIDAGKEIFDQLDAVKCADLVVVVWDGSFEVDPLLKTCLLAQGLPPTQHLLYEDTLLPDKERLGKRKEFNDVLQHCFNNKSHKIHYISQPSDYSTLTWGLVNFKHHTLGFLQHRSYLVTSSVEFQEGEGDSGTLALTGYIRGRAMDANQLVHLPGYGHFNIQKIVTAQEEFSDHAKPTERKEYLPTSAPSLEMECEVDEMDAEQTWPTEEEIQAAEMERKNAKRVPKGTSSYQAVWMMSDDEEEDEEDEDDMSEEESAEEESEEEYEDLQSQDEDETEDYDLRFDAEEEAEELRKFREAVDHEEYPDELDTPVDTPARVRFQKYRGLKSFRTSPWDPKENLPRDYSRISQIANFRNIRKHLLKPVQREVKCGAYVHVFIEKVPSAIKESTRNCMTMFTLLEHEHKMSVQHVSQQRHVLSGAVVKSKEQLLVQVGFRRYVVNPIFSQHTKANKHKLERFMPNSGPFVASFYAPITLSESPAVIFKLEEDRTVSLLSTGALHSCDPDRVICKRIVLSGHPCKVHKRSAVVRYLFYNREDIVYFKKIEIRTKHGRRGHIKEALGTHGHCKIHFDKPIQQSDTVIMCLYKRVFPAWSFNYF